MMETMAGSRPLYSVEAEMSVLGSMLLSERAADDVRLVLDEEMFYRPGNRLVYRAMQELRKGFKPVDLVTLVEELKAKGELGNVGGQNYLTELEMFMPSPAQALQYAEIVRSMAMLRMLESTGRQLVGKVQDYEGGTPVEIGRWVCETAATIGGASTGIRPMADVDEAGGDEGIATGIKGIDRKLGTKGAPKGQMNVVVAKEKAGKSTLMMQMALNAAQAGKGVLYLSLADLNAKRVKRRMLRMLCGYSERWTADQAGFLPEFQAAKAELEDYLTLEIGDMRSLGTVDVAELIATAQGYQQRRARTAVPLDMVFVDYAQKLKAKGFRSSDKTAMADHCSNALADFAERTGLVVWVGSQLTDGDAKAGRELITKQSRAWLEDCGLCLHLERHGEEAAPVNIYRSRFGGMGKRVDMKFNPTYVRFDEVGL